MRVWVYVPTALALGAAAFFATTAIASDLPKEGTFKLVGNAHGTGKIMPPGNPADVGLWEEMGKAQIAELLVNDGEMRCFGISETINGVHKTPNGYCFITAKDGDQLVLRINDVADPHSISVYKCSGDLIIGTGKYKGIVGTVTFAAHTSSEVTGYTNHIDGQGNYKIP